MLYLYAALRPHPFLHLISFRRCGYGAGDRSRTRDLLITNQPLYRLSYASNSRNSRQDQLAKQSEKDAG